MGHNLGEIIYVNYLGAEGTPFADFEVIARPIAVVDMRQMYDRLARLSRDGVADAEFKGDFIFIKGDDHKVVEMLHEKSAFIGPEGEIMRLNVNEHLNIMRALFYKAFFRYAEKRGFRPFRGRKGDKRKKLLPLNISSESLTKQELFVMINNDLALYRGLYIMLEIFDDGSAVLWVDLYSPIVKLSEQRPLSPREAKMLGLKDIYTSFIPSPSKRFELTKKLLSILCTDSRLNIEFSDRYSISFSCNLSTIKTA